jgi:hypothetical protein
VRKQDSNGDYVFGTGQSSFWINQAEMVGQIISTRLMLYQSEWFLDTTDGTPWNTQVLGKYTDSTRDPVIQARVLGTPQVAGISGYNSQVIPPTRTFNAAMSVNTTFGPVTVTAQLPSVSVTTQASQLPPTQFLVPVAQTPYSVLVTWSTTPIFTLDSPKYGLLDSSNPIG